jgi:hypothetical protein
MKVKVIHVSSKLVKLVLGAIATNEPVRIEADDVAVFNKEINIGALRYPRPYR